MDQIENAEITQKPEKVCPLCNGVEWKFSAKDGITSAERCECFQKKLSAKLLSLANIPGKYARCSFDNFSKMDLDDAASKSLGNAMLMARNFAREFPLKSDPRGLLIFGRNGIGKTHLAVAAFRRILDAGFEGRFINYQALLELIRSGFDKAFGEGRTAKYDEIERMTVLLIDDLGANRVTDWVEDAVTQLIAYRHDHQLSTIVTTNYTPSPSENYLGDRIGERATSRLREMCKMVPMPNVTDKRGTNPHASAPSIFGR